MSTILKAVTEDQLVDVLHKHVEWVNNGGKAGSRADFSGHDLRGEKLVKAAKRVDPHGPLMLKDALLNEADFSGSELSGACLCGAELIGAIMVEVPCLGTNFEGADLTGADLQGAKLDRATLKDAVLTDTNLADCSMRDAKLQAVKGLRPGQLTGCDLTLAELPEGIKAFESLKLVSEHVETARKLQFGLLLACTYCWLTLAITTDAMILANSSTSNLPVIGSSVPIVGFYVVAPLLLTSLFVYFQLILQRLWERLARLPAVFPDGESLHEKTSIWPFAGVVCSYVILLRTHKPAFYGFQYLLVILLGWLVLPITIYWFFEDSLPMHNLRVSVYLTVLLTVVTLLSWIFLHVGIATLQRGLIAVTFKTLIRRMVGRTFDFPDTPSMWLRQLHDVAGFAISAIGVGSIFFSVVYFIPFSNPVSDIYLEQVAANIRDQDLSTKPPFWDPNSANLSVVMGARLNGQRLEFAQASGAFFVNADLRHANLSRGHFDRADLRGARMDSATVVETDLTEANMKFSRINRAQVVNCALVRADIDSAEAIGANFHGTDLRYAKLRFTDFSGADFSNANLQGAVFEGANLSNANFRGAALMGAISLHLANLQNANFCGANLENVHHLTSQQWDTMITDSTTIKPNDLE